MADPNTTLNGTVDFGAGSTSVSTSTVVAASGKIVVGGYVTLSGSTTSDFTLVRYNVDRSIDTTFGIGGKIVADFGGDDKGYSVAVDAQGRIFIAGSTIAGGKTSFALMCYKADGTLDTTFGAGGKLITDFNSSDDNKGYSLQIDASGRLLIAGSALISGKRDVAVVRYTATGILDTSFGSGGKVTTDCGGDDDEAKSITIDSSGRIVVAGTAVINGKRDFTVIRYTADGSLDTSFGVGGKVTTDCGGDDDEGKSLKIDVSGNILVAGTAVINGQRDFTIVRYKADGSLDTSFGTGGKVTIDCGGDDDARTMTIDSSGKILIGGSLKINGSTDSVIIRLNANGSLDTSFGVNGKLIKDYGGNDEINSITLDASGQLVLAGVTYNTGNGGLPFVNYQSYQVAGTVRRSTGYDFNNDGNSDLFSYNSKSGVLKIWLMDGNQVGDAIEVRGPKGKKWQVCGAGDFNGDGKTDLLWHDRKSGKAEVWLMDGSNKVGTIKLPKLKGKWTIGGVADFNQDGTADVICHDSKSGKTQILQMNGAGVAARITLPKMKGKWTIAGLADFNQDGKADVLWRDQKSGKTQVWILDGGRYSSRIELPKLSANWEFKGVTDLDGDGNVDIVCQDKRTGATQVWFLDGGRISLQAGVVGVNQANCKIQGVGDFDGDGKGEIVWQNQVSGATGFWSLKSVTEVGLGGQASRWQETRISASGSYQFAATSQGLGVF
ncbi:FG-GAP-like repeat-containing protein [Pantanalinema rosaneae CENA516]|uniref:FG-GAP-like repeat-containing protein n=1 Tax=Pantanalinema rosaneae TaxID=1620701 RepID=UPI003D6EDC14